MTKYRRSVFTGETIDLIEKSFREVAKKMNFQVLEFNGESNHVHALIEYPPKLSISQIVNALNGVSSCRYGQAGHKKLHKEALWSPSYFAVSVGGAPLEVLKEYIRNQEKPATEEGACIPISWSKFPKLARSKFGRIVIYLMAQSSNSCSSSRKMRLFIS